MATIKPSFTLTANSSKATSNPGPLSIALSLSVTDSLTVDRAQSEIKTVGDSVVAILDGSALLAIDSGNR